MLILIVVIVSILIIVNYLCRIEDQIKKSNTLLEQILEKTKIEE